jgi:hypothetical protein
LNKHNIIIIGIKDILLGGLLFNDSQNDIF